MIPATACLHFVFEKSCARSQFFVGKFLDGRFQRIDLLNKWLNGFEIALIAAAKYFS